MCVSEDLVLSVVCSRSLSFNACVFFDLVFCSNDFSQQRACVPDSPVSR